MSTSPVAIATRPPSSRVPAPGRPSARNESFFKILSQFRGRPPPLSKAPPLAASTAAPATGACRKPDEEDPGQASPERKRRTLAEPDPSDLLDPITRQLGVSCFVDRTSGSQPVAAEPLRALRARSASLEDLFGVLVRRASWSLGSDRRCATLRLEIGTGALEGSSIIISADPHELQIVLDAPPGVDMEAWKDRLRRRLASQGLAATFP